MKDTHTWQNENQKRRGWEREPGSPSHSSPMILFICENRRLECPCGVIWKLQLLKGSLVWLQLRHTRCYRTDCLSLLFHATIMMMPRAPSTIAPPPVLRQNCETLARLASWRSKPPDVDTWPHTIFIRSSVLRRKLKSLLPLVLRVKLRNRRGAFEV
jgi:hypothetical protein